MRSALCFILLLTSQSVFARSLVPLDRLPSKERAKIEHASRASFNFRFDPGVSCTGTFISDQGHFLTALHCLSNCLIKQRAVIKSRATDEPLVTSGGKRTHAYLMTVNEDKVDEGVECAGSLNGKPFHATVVMTGGKGWMTPKAEVAAFAKQNADEYRRLLDDGYEHGFDFAILKTDPPASCLPLASATPPVGDALKAIPYACVERSNFKTAGKLALFTTGVRTESFKKSEYYKNRAPASLPFDPKLIDRPDTFFSSLDLEKCGSGTGIFNNQNRLVGVATRVYKSTTDYEYGSLEAVSAARITREISQKLNASAAKDVMTCTASGTPPASAPKTKGQTHARN